MNFFINRSEEHLDATMVLYMRRIGAYGKDNFILMNTFKEWLEEENLVCDDTVILAMALDNPNTTEPEKCRYDVCMIPFTNRNIDSDKVKSRQLAGGKYVTFLIEHTAEMVQRAWTECFTEIEKCGYFLDVSRPIMERYAKKLVDNHSCELCVPVL